MLFLYHNMLHFGNKYILLLFRMQCENHMCTFPLTHSLSLSLSFSIWAGVDKSEITIVVFVSDQYEINTPTCEEHVRVCARVFCVCACVCVVCVCARV